MATINSDGVRIPKSAREAVARHEDVVVLNHDRPVFLIVNPEERRSSAHIPRGRTLREAAATLLAAPLPDPEFALDLAAVIASAGPLPEDPWGRS
jgi:antitoxin (DNA-binding transcriptional repressor) of toxin-antitoxin stability system